MANAETTRTATGGPYRRQHVVFAADRGDPGFLDSLAAASGTIASGAAPAGTLPAFHPAGGATVATGVHIAQVVEDPAPPLKRYDPGHPDAGPDGYVAYPDINPLTEMVDLMGATRAYGLNGSAVQAEKGMIASALEIAKS
jgi:flagellar basal-body rod protein FlgC